MTNGLSPRGGPLRATPEGGDTGRATPAAEAPLESEIEDAVERLSEKWAQAAATQRTASAPGLVVQSLAPGRKHAVAVEIRRRPRGRDRPGGPEGDKPTDAGGEPE